MEKKAADEKKKAVDEKKKAALETKPSRSSKKKKVTKSAAPHAEPEHDAMIG